MALAPRYRPKAHATTAPLCPMFTAKSGKKLHWDNDRTPLDRSSESQLCLKGRFCFCPGGAFYSFRHVPRGPESGPWSLVSRV